MISSIVSRLVILVFGTLYPAYASYKAVRAKNVKEYVKWMMYWIVFALFTCAETFTDVFLSFWFPFYYEIKVILVLWLLSPATKGSSILYRKFVHPMLTKREQEIDEYIARAKEQGYHTVLSLGTKGVNYATSVIMQTAIKGGGGLVNQLRRSYSLGDISSDIDMMSDVNRVTQHPDDQMDHTDASIDARLLRPRGYNTRSSPSGGIVEMYFPEMDVDVRQRRPRSREPSIPLSQIRSNEDVSSGYSSGEVLYATAGHPRTEAAPEQSLVRTSSVGSTRVTRTKTPRAPVVTTKRTQPTEDSISSDESEDTDSQNQEDQFFDVATTAEPVSVPYHKTTSFPVSAHSASGQTDLPTKLLSAAQDQPLVPVQFLSSLNNSTSSVDLPPTFVENQFASSKSDDIIKEQPVISVSPIDVSTADISVSPDALALLSKTLEECKTEVMSAVNTPFVEYSNDDISVDTDDFANVTPIRMPLVILPSTRSNTAGTTGLVKVPPINSVGRIIKEAQDANHKIASSAITHTDLPVVDESPADIFYEPLETFPTESKTSVIILSSDDTELADADNELFEDSSSGVLPSDMALSNTEDKTFSDCNRDNISSKSEASTEKVSILDGGKADRAGKYNKRPAPGPPKQSDVELLKPGVESAAYVTTSALEVTTPETVIQQIPLPINEGDALAPVAGDRERAVASDEQASFVHAKLTAQELPGVMKEKSEIIKTEQIPFPQIPPRPSGHPSVKPSESEKAQLDVSVTTFPTQSQKKAKTKQDSSISRLFSMPKAQLASIFPFLGHDSSRGLTATSLTSLSGDLEDQLRGAMHGSLIDLPTATHPNSRNTGCNSMQPPLLLPRKKSQGDIERNVANSGKMFEKCETSENGTSQFRMREMSHSPPRRQTNL